MTTKRISFKQLGEEFMELSAEVDRTYKEYIGIMKDAQLLNYYLEERCTELIVMSFCELTLAIRFIASCSKKHDEFIGIYDTFKKVNAQRERYIRLDDKSKASMIKKDIEMLKVLKKDNLEKIDRYYRYEPMAQEYIKDRIEMFGTKAQKRFYINNRVSELFTI